MSQFTADEMAKIRAYLCHKLGNAHITLRPREKASDSAEVLIKGEFIGLVYKDEDDGEISYNMTMAILDMDLADVA